MADGVDIFRRIVGLIFKWLLYATLIISGIVAVIAGAVYGYNWYNHDRHIQNIAIDISTSKADCSDDAFPIRVRMLNNSSKVLERTTFRLEARFKDRSTNLVRYHSYEDDHISLPKMGYSQCWKVPELTEKVDDPRTLEWSIASSTFHLRD